MSKKRFAMPITLHFAQVSFISNLSKYRCWICIYFWNIT